MSECCRCQRGPIGPQGSPGQQGKIVIGFNGLPIIIQPRKAFNIFPIPLRVTNPNTSIIYFGYDFIGDLVDIEKIRVYSNTPFSDPVNPNIKWKFAFFFSQDTTTAIELKIRIVFYVLPSPSILSGNTEENYKIIVETEDGQSEIIEF